MSVNITVAVPLDAIAAIKSGNSGSTMGAALSATSRAVVAAVLALPYDIKSSTSSEDNDATQTDGGVEGGKSAAFALAQSHLDDTFTITVMHRAEAKPAAVIRVHGSTKVGQLAQLIQDETEVSKYLQYLVYDHKPFYDGSRGTYDEDVTLHEVGISDENAMVQLVYQL